MRTNQDSARSSGKFFARIPPAEKEKTSEDVMNEVIAHFDGGRYQKSVEKLDEAIEINSHEPLTNVLYYYRANAKSKLGDFVSAVIDYNEAIAYAPKKSHYYYHRANAHYQNESYENAEKDYLAYMKIEGESADIHMKLGFLKQGENALKGAVSEFTKAITLNPKLAEAYFLRGAVYLRVLMHEQGCEDMQKAAELGHERADRRYTKYCENN